MSEQTTISIDPSAALQETLQLVEHYRNRNLVLAQQELTARRQVEELQSALEAANAQIKTLTKVLERKSDRALDGEVSNGAH